MSSRKWVHPTQHLADLDTRRAEILDQAPAQAKALGVDEQDIIAALVQIDSVARAHGDPERGQMIAEIEMEHIRQDQDRDAYENIETVFKEIVAEALAAGPDYVTEEQELDCN